MICAYIYFYGVTEKRNWNGEYGEYIYLISQSDIGQTEKKTFWRMSPSPWLISWFKCGMGEAIASIVCPQRRI